MTDARPLDDADVVALRGVIGAALAVTVRPYVEYATVDSMRNFALGYGDDASDIASRVVQRLRATRADALNVRVHVAGLTPAVAREQIETFGREVLPLLREEWPA